MIGRDFLSDELLPLLEVAFACNDVTDKIRGLAKDSAQILIDVIDEARYVSLHMYSTEPALMQSVRQAIDQPGSPPPARGMCLRQLYRICGYHALLPKTLQIPFCYDRTSFPLYRGGYADVWKGTHHGLDVAVKVIRIYSNSDLQKIIDVGY